MSLPLSRMKYILALVVLSVSVVEDGYCADGNPVLAPAEIVLLSPFHIHTQPGKELAIQHLIITSDTLTLLNKSRWQSKSKESLLPIDPKTALAKAIVSIPLALRAQVAPSLTGINLRPLWPNVLPDVWFYEVEFRPLNSTQSGFDLERNHVAIVLMDGTTLVPRTGDALEHIQIVKGKKCRYVERDGSWVQESCN